MIKSVQYSDRDALLAIKELYLEDEWFELDPTYSKGNFYKELPKPKLKYDLYPQSSEVEKGDCINLYNIESSTIASIVFDPPFLAGYTKQKQTGIMGRRFSGFRYMQDVWEFYEKSLIEFYRILKTDGILAFKCQDTVSSGKQWFSHNYIMNKAIEIGYKGEDLFVLIANRRIIGHNHKNQKYARKYHAYWLVFKK